jgi:hypothetical protein
MIESPLSAVVTDVRPVESCGCQWVKFSHHDGNHFWRLLRAPAVMCSWLHEEPA